MDDAWGHDGPPADVIAVAHCAVILGLDVSSTMIGYVVHAGSVRDYGEIKLAGSHADRCRKAFASVGLIIETHPDIDCIAIESPVARFASAVIAQSRVAGAVLTRAALFGLHVIEVTPTEAKRALTGVGNADKSTMQGRAKGWGVTGEHASDALGIALHAAGRVEVVA